MDIYSASDGSLIQLQKQLSEYESLRQLTYDVAVATGLNEPNVLLFFEDGGEVKDDNIEAAWERGGRGSPSQIGVTTLYLFNRETFWSDAETWAAQYQEEVEMPPQLNLSALSDIPQAQHPFLLAIDHLSHLQSLFVAQSRALSIAYANLNHHLGPLLREFETFSKRAQTELDAEAGLLRGSKTDMAMLPKIIVHEAFLRKKDKEDANKVTTLADYISSRRMEQVRETCEVAYEDHLTRYEGLVQMMDELEAHSEAERRAFEARSNSVSQEFADGLEKMELAVNQVEALLSGAATEGAAQDLMELDTAMRDDLVALIAVKNDFTLEIHLHLRQVAQFQIRITEIVNPLTQLETELVSKSAFPHLFRLNQLPFAYGASVIEVVRRKDFSKALMSWLDKLQRALNVFTNQEKSRRSQIKEHVLVQLPWQVAILEDTSQVGVELSVIDGAEILDQVHVGQHDIDALLRAFGELANDRDIISTVKGTEHPINVLCDRLRGVIAESNAPLQDLEKLALGLMHKPDEQKPDQSLSTQLRIVEQERAEASVKLEKAQKAHDARVREMSDVFESREASMQARQSELQDELVRLRTDLGEEMLARQALSTQLDTTTRAHEDRLRDHDDQAELVTALQAELAQEKDRATDLGVRLQEALLDVDGLRNAEHSLASQIQTLQDERSTTMQRLSQSQSDSRNLETQLAGLQAELDATASQLSQARKECDQAHRNQSAEAERMMRDRIAEADGDRAVLEHQNLTLTKQLDDLKVESDEKLSAARNGAIRQADGLKAELSLTRAQLREVQRRETVLADELAMAKDAATAISYETNNRSDLSRDAVTLVIKYYDTCQRLLGAINASSTINGTATNASRHLKSPPASAAVSVSSKDEMRDSIMGKSLATAASFDLVAFSEAVQRTISLVKKWSKSCKSYRDLSRSKISYNNFSKGDLGLFLPTKNVVARAWAAFNVSAPHHFLKMTENIRALTVNREYILARIVDTDEAIASGGDSLPTNPFGLADGLRYYVHEVELYDPQTVKTPSRRSTSASFSQSVTQARPIIPRANSSQTGPSPFTPTPIKPLPEPLGSSQPTSPLAELSRNQEPRDSSASESAESPLAQSPPPMEDTVFPPPTAVSAVPMVRRESQKLSPVAESGITLPAEPGPFAIPPPQAPSTLPRSASRSSASPKDSSLAVFAPALQARPVSVASSSSSHLRAASNQGTKAAPSMAVTMSNQSSSPSKASAPLPVRRVSRKASYNSLSPHGDDIFLPSPLGTTPPVESAINASREPSGSFQTLGTKTGKPIAGDDPGVRRVSFEANRSPTPSKLMGSRLLSGFTGKPRTISSGATSADKPTAMDMLKRFGQN